MNLSQVINQMIILLLILILGYISYKMHIIDDEMQGKLTNLILSVTTPCLILGSVSSESTYSKSTIFYVLGIALALYCILPIMAWFLNKILRVNKEDEGLYMFMTVFSNIGFMGYPVIRTIFGDEAVFLCSLFNMIFSIFVYSLGVYLITLGKKETVKFNPKQMISPAMISSLLALVLFLTENQLPGVLLETCQTVGDVTTPLAMMLIGASLASMPIKEIFNEYRLYPYMIIKQIVIPMICFYVLQLLIKDSLVLGITVVVLAMPVGTSAIMFTNQYGGDTKLAAKGIFITTIASFITIPILCTLF